VLIVMTWMIGIAILLCAWGILSVLGAERTRMMHKMQQDWRQQQALAARRAADASK